MKALREDERFDQVDVWLEQIHKRFDHIDERFDRLEKRLEDGFEGVTEQFVNLRACTEFGNERLDKSLHALSGGLSRLERKLDRILALSVESRGRNRQ